ncbi:MAG: hypothetical protein CXR31_00075 [Geobacter sp.]|nr:MAG: hypothetical protein CXR31_00075 [Geobacter sp.]
MRLTVTDKERQDGSLATTLVIEGPVTIRQVDELKVVLVATLTEAESVRLDLSGVTATDPAFLQLLVSARLTAARSGRELTVMPTPSEAYAQGVVAAGFHSVGACRQDVQEKE